ncbi:MAG: crossover junction endodeoxyribonuclease RuvC [Planctomycetota bacterium]|nr:crossover junction endodeoxyribonuclease RuvC [Planctomycetota bacterium]
MTPPVRPKPFVVLGIDPGTRVVGYGAIVDAARGPRLYAAGVLRAPAEGDVPARLAHIRRELDELIAKLGPAVVVVEQAFASKNLQSALRIGEGRGVILACAAGAGATVVQLPPAVAKKALVGHGAADKRQVARMVMHALDVRELDLPLDATDALALALAHLQRTKLALPARGARALPAAIERAVQAAGRRSRPAAAIRAEPDGRAAPAKGIELGGRTGRNRRSASVNAIVAHAARPVRRRA